MANGITFGKCVLFMYDGLPDDIIIKPILGLCAKLVKDKHQESFEKQIWATVERIYENNMIELTDEERHRITESLKKEEMFYLLDAEYSKQEIYFIEGAIV